MSPSWSATAMYRAVPHPVPANLHRARRPVHGSAGSECRTGSASGSGVGSADPVDPTTAVHRDQGLLHVAQGDAPVVDVMADPLAGRGQPPGGRTLVERQI